MNERSRPIMTLAHLFELIKCSLPLTRQTRSELLSAIRRFCEICGQDPTQVLADPAAIRNLREAASWQIAGLTACSWANIVSRVSRALALGGVDVARRRRNTRLSPGWASLLGDVSFDQNKRLRRLAGFCSSRDVAPSDVTSASFTAFFEFLDTQSVQKNPRDRWNEARRTWNDVVAGPGSGYPAISNIASNCRRSRSVSEFPETLQWEIDAWCKRLGDASPHEDREPLRPATIRNYRMELRRYVSWLADDGVPIESLNSLSTLLRPEIVIRRLNGYGPSSQLPKFRGRLHMTVQTLLSAYRCAVVETSLRDDRELQRSFDILRRTAGKVRDFGGSMVQKNRDRLAKLDNPTAAKLFRNLHTTVARRYAQVEKPTVAQALEMQMASVHALLLDAPLRISNVARLALDRHVTTPAGGKPGQWRFAFPGSEMKNHDPFESLLSIDTSAFLQDYVSRFRPALLKATTSILFVSSRTGLAKSPETLSRQYAAFIKRELGVTVNPHLLRHHAGMLWLNNMPGEYRGLSKLLGHRSEQTTIKAYTGAESRTAQDRYQTMLASQRRHDTEQEQASRALGITPRSVGR